MSLYQNLMKRQALIEQGKEAFKKRCYLKAVKLYEQAKIFANDDRTNKMLDLYIEVALSYSKRGKK